MRRRRVSTGHAFADLGIAMGLLGLLVGAVFPPVVVVLGVARPEDAYQPVFQWICLGAGLLVGTANFVLARRLVGARIEKLNGSMAATGLAVRQRVRQDQRTAPVGGLTLHALPVDSRDSFGAMATRFNELLESLERSLTGQRSLQAVTNAAGDVWSLDSSRATVSRHLLQVLVTTHGDLAWARFSVHDQDTGPAGLLLAEADAPLDVPVFPVYEVEHVFDLGDGHQRGTLTLGLRDQRLTGHAADLLNGVADTLTLALSRLDLHSQVQRQACFDDLTGVLNRREGLSRIRQTVEGKAPTVPDPQGLGLLMVDLDHFKSINDHYGHLAGDEVLRGVGALCRNLFRRTEVVCRYGGEEILVLLTGVDEDAVRISAERLRTAVAAATFLSDTAGAPVRVTASIGARWWRRHGGDDDLTGYIADADSALYEAKAGGRDRVVLHPGVSVAEPASRT